MTATVVNAPEKNNLIEFFTIRRYLHQCKCKLKANVGKSKINSAKNFPSASIEHGTIGLWDLL